MIVSHAHRFIFVRTRKTASTSLEIAFGSVAGDQDIVTPITVKGDQHLLRNYVPRNYEATSTSPAAFNHMPASMIIDRVGQEVWGDYLTFAVERNPWDRAVSLYYFNTAREARRPSFTKWLKIVSLIELSNYHCYSVDGAIAVNRFLRYETLDSNLPGLLREIGLAGLQLPRAKTHYRPPVARDWRRMYDDESASYVAGVCREEIRLFDYRFDDGPVSSD